MRTTALLDDATKKAAARRVIAAQAVKSVFFMIVTSLDS